PPGLRAIRRPTLRGAPAASRGLRRAGEPARDRRARPRAYRVHGPRRDHVSQDRTRRHPRGGRRPRPALSVAYARSTHPHGVPRHGPPQSARGGSRRGCAAAPRDGAQDRPRPLIAAWRLPSRAAAARPCQERPPGIGLAFPCTRRARLCCEAALMPELPDVTVYIESLDARIRGATLERVRLASPFVVRSFEPPIGAAHGRTVRALRRLGKRIVIELEGDLFLIIHLM